jgi:ribonuclease E
VATPRKRAAKKVAAARPDDSTAAVGADEPSAPKAAKTTRTPAKRSARGRASTAADSTAESSAGAASPAVPAAAPAIPTVLFQAPAATAAPARTRRSAAGAGTGPGTTPAGTTPAGTTPAGTTPAATATSETAEVSSSAPGSTDAEGDTEREGSRRRRRGGRGRRGGRDNTHDGARDEAGGEASDADLAVAEGAGSHADHGDGGRDHNDEHGSDHDDDHGDEHDGDHDGEHDGDGTSASSRRRRRRRRRGSGGDGDEHASDDPPNTVVRVREPREHDGTSGVQGVKGSTRLEAKKQRRREGREQIRRGRRGLVITEAEFLARRESVDRVMAVRQRGDRTQIGVLEDGILVEHFVSTASANRMVGNVFLGRVQNVLPGMEAAFVDIGKGRNAVLYAGEVNFDISGIEGQPRRIEQALKPGQSVLVQVTKDPIGHKGARLTSQVSLPGRFLVYVPEGSMMGISRKLPDVERSRLKAILKKVMPEGAGVIVRTAAEGASEEELSRDVARLAAQWEDIKKKSETASAPSLLYGEPDLTIRVIRDVFNEDFNSLVVQAESEWDTVEAYVGHVAPDLVSRLSRWTSEEDVFTHYRVDEQIAKALDRKVWLPSGGYLIIDRTEAMIVIDVNTGRFIGKGGNLEETVTKNNLEAAEEIVRQLRLRDIGGIIVIDFIDMVLESNRELVLRRLVECLGRDRTKHQVAEVTSLGLVQMTRKRVGNGLLEAFSETCETCNGRGVIVHSDPVDQRAPRPAAPSVPKPSAVAKAGSRGGGRGKRAAAADVEPAAVETAAVETAAVESADGGDSTNEQPPGGSDDHGGASGNGTASSGSRTRRGGRRRGGSKPAAATESVPEPA